MALEVSSSQLWLTISAGRFGFHLRTDDTQDTYESKTRRYPSLECRSQLAVNGG